MPSMTSYSYHFSFLKSTLSTYYSKFWLINFTWTILGLLHDFTITSYPLSFYLYSISICLISFFNFKIFKNFLLFWQMPPYIFLMIFPQSFLVVFLWTWHKLDISRKRNLNWKTSSIKLAYRWICQTFYW